MQEQLLRKAHQREAQQHDAAISAMDEEQKRY